MSQSHSQDSQGEIAGWRTNLGKVVTKLSGKPFKSRLKTATVKGFATNPVTGRLCYTFAEDDSMVECRRCTTIGEAQVITNKPKWTPGPRVLQEVVNDNEVSITVWNDQYICIAEFICPRGDAEALEATRADANLDAVAPKMYELLADMRAEPLACVVHGKSAGMAAPVTDKHGIPCTCWACERQRKVNALCLEAEGRK